MLDHILSYVSPGFQKRKFANENLMSKQFTSVITVEFAYNNREANSKKEYIELLKQQYLEQHDIELEDHEITQIEEIKND